MTTRIHLFLLALGAFAALTVSSGHAHADPYCGAGNNYDAAHSMCGPWMPRPVPGLLPYPLPGDSGPGGHSYGPYGGPYGGN